MSRIDDWANACLVKQGLASINLANNEIVFPKQVTPRKFDKADPRGQIKKASWEHEKRMARVASYPSQTITPCYIKKGKRVQIAPARTVAKGFWSYTLAALGHSFFAHEFDYRQLEIECGETFTKVDELSQLQRQLVEDESLRVQLDDQGRVVKLISRREPEYMQGREEFFITAQDGARIPISEDELDELVGNQANSEDVYIAAAEGKVELKDIESEFSTPRDMYDISFDATEFLQQVDSMDWSEVEGDPSEILDELADEYIYSADWFPRKADKRIRSKACREALAKIQSSRESLPKQVIMQLIGKSLDKRLSMIQELEKQAHSLKPGKMKASLLLRAQTIKLSRIRDLQRSRCKWVDLHAELDPLAIQTPADRKAFIAAYRQATPGPIKLKFRVNSSKSLEGEAHHIWDAWAKHENEVKGGVVLTSWQYRLKVSFKLGEKIAKGFLTREEAQEYISKKMQELFEMRNMQLQIGEMLNRPSWATSQEREETAQEGPGLEEIPEELLIEGYEEMEIEE